MKGCISSNPVPGGRRWLLPTSLGQVHCVDTGGPSDQVPLLLLHQTPRSIDEFAEVIPLLAPTRRVLAIDTPGYGCSDQPVSPPTVADYAGALIEVLDALDIGRLHIAGHHTGAILGMEIALLNPARIAGLTLSGPVYLDADGRRALSKAFKQWTVQDSGSHLGEKWNKFSGWIEGASLVQRAVTDLFRAGETSEWGHFAVADYPMETRLPRLDCPLQLIVGTEDPFCDPPSIARFEALPGHRATDRMPGGVFLPNQSPAAWASAVAEFAAGLSLD